jgi:hypothetical protein
VQSNDSNNDADNSDSSKDKKSKKKTADKKSTASSSKSLLGIITAENSNSMLSKIENQGIGSAPLVKGDASEKTKTENKGFRDKFTALISIFVVIFLLGYLLKGVEIVKYFKKH